MKVEMNSNRPYVEQSGLNNKVPAVKDEKAENKVEKSNETTEERNERVREIVEKLNKELETVDTSLEFKVHESYGNGLNKISIKVVEKESEKVIVEIPSEETIELAEKMEAITGILFDHSR